ncbi:hypothetical protein [Thermococcus sibiricus]|uniref:Uncharacterized protein n=2 Tax=Thermococcus sibiricus TaxID=172049 RepID=C6A1W6_THESM|nr:hypothetical protein [Thermococcus sibiricus]ACS89611.1 hypothetical protein TSIB_0545 [Thermococcus sibiricus MM 739]KUK16630.1 MAG: Uncharacterized protein XD54_2080 [Thermococcus sibiricus]
MKKWKIVAIFLVFILLAFYFGSFGFGKSEIHSSTQVGAASTKNATFKEGFCVYPDSKFGRVVAEELQNRGYEISVIGSPAECNSQFLAVWVEEINTTYSPFVAKGAIKVKAVYSSLGKPDHYLKYLNATDKERELITFISNVDGEMQGYLVAYVTDSSKGLMSFRWYQEHLMEEVAKNLINSLVSAIENAKIRK